MEKLTAKEIKNIVMTVVLAGGVFFLGGKYIDAKKEIARIESQGKVITEVQRNTIYAIEVMQTSLKTFTEGSYNILNKQGRPIDLENIKAAKDIRITHTDSDFPDEAELEKEKILYLQEIMHEKSTNKN